jgi:hypothetical protein
VEVRPEPVSFSEAPGVIVPEQFDLSELYAKLGAKEHPVLELPSEEAVRNLVDQGEAGLKVLKDGLSKRAKLIKLMKDDPLHYGWEPECWKDAREILTKRPDLLIMGGNRSAKTEFAAKEAVIDLVNQPNRIWAFFPFFRGQQQAAAASTTSPVSAAGMAGRGQGGANDVRLLHGKGRLHGQCVYSCRTDREPTFSTTSRM